MEFFLLERGSSAVISRVFRFSDFHLKKITADVSGV